MSKIAVVYWSGTGNTEAMASAVAEGVKSKGAEAALLTAAEFSAGQLGEFGRAAGRVQRRRLRLPGHGGGTAGGERVRADVHCL